jgi:hypothetical protein
MDCHARTNRAKGTIATMKSKKTSTNTGTADVAQQGAHSASKKPASKRAASPKEGAPTASTGAKEAPTRVTATAKSTAKRPAACTATQEKSMSVPGKLTKKGTILDLLRRANGASLSELAEAAGWKPNSILGFLSGNLRKKMGLVIESSRQKGRERIYKVK